MALNNIINKTELIKNQNKQNENGIFLFKKEENNN